MGDNLNNNEVLPIPNAMVDEMMRQSSINPCHITKNIIFLITGFDTDQMNMVNLEMPCRFLYSKSASNHVHSLRRYSPASSTTPQQALPPWQCCTSHRSTQGDSGHLTAGSSITWGHTELLIQGITLWGTPDILLPFFGDPTIGSPPPKMSCGSQTGCRT